jgi:L-alanine-DL-glutamate epimerase-like enolase superfamily enzyme
MNPLHTAVSHGIAQGGVQISRRAALASGLALAAAPSQALARSRSVKIERIEIFPLRYPMTGFFKFFTGPHGGAGRAAVIVKVTADDGTFGWGQSVPIAKWSYETLEAATTTLAEYYRPALLGHDPTDIAGAHRKMDSVVAPGFSTGMPITRAGIDIALWDIVGKLADLPLYKLWGRNVAKPLTLSWTVNAVTLDDVDGLIEEGRRRGYQNFNIKVGPDADYDVQLASRVKRLAPNGFLWSDANGGYAPQDALAAAPRLADAGVDVLEAPVKPNRISTYRALKKQAALPIYMDEGIVSPVELTEFIKLEMLDGVAMKPARCGGLTSCKRQIEIVRDAGLGWLGSGLTDPDISLAATLHLYAAFDQKRPCALNGPQFLTADVLTKPLKIVDGQAHVPEGPGLGIDVDEQQVRDLVERTRRASRRQE